MCCLYSKSTTQLIIFMSFCDHKITDSFLLGKQGGKSFHFLPMFSSQPLKFTVTTFHPLICCCCCFLPGVWSNYHLFYGFLLLLSYDHSKTSETCTRFLCRTKILRALTWMNCKGCFFGGRVICWVPVVCLYNFFCYICLLILRTEKLKL